MNFLKGPQGIHSAPDQDPGAGDQYSFAMVHSTGGPDLSILTAVYVAAYITLYHVHLGKRFQHPIAVVYSALIAGKSRRTAVNITAHVTLEPHKFTSHS